LTLHRDTVIAHFLGQLGIGLTLPYLSEHLVDVRVGLDVEVGVQLQFAVIGIERIHVIQVVDAAHLLFDGGRNGLLYRLRVRADIRGVDDYFRGHNVGVLGNGQAEDGHATHDDHDDCNDDGDDRPVDEELSHGGLPLFRFRLDFASGFASGFCAASGSGLASGFAPGFCAGRASAFASPVKGFGLTTMPSRTFWVPSATTFSPAFRPSSITQSSPYRSAAFTCLIAILFSGPAIATRYWPWTSDIARCGMTNAPFLIAVCARTRANCPGLRMFCGFGRWLPP